MENKSGRRISLNFFDILIIIIVIALTAGLIYVKTRGGSEGQASDAAMVTYEIEIGNLTEDTQNLIHAGDSVIDKVKKQEMGEVVSCEFYPMRKESVNLQTGDTLYPEVPGAGPPLPAPSGSYCLCFIRSLVNPALPLLALILVSLGPELI